MSEFEPVQLGAYRLVQKLGSGGFATVFRAVAAGEMGFERQVAVKLLHGHVVASRPGVSMALADEARLLGRIRHPNIVSAQWFGELEHPEEGPVYAIVMDFVPGKTWRDLLLEARKVGSRVSVPEAVDVHLALARALDYAHTLTDDEGRPMGLVHRDLKPENVMISELGEVKLLDFGIAKARDRLAETTEAGTVRGTVTYMSPEQVSGKEITFRSDHFSLGSMLHEALTGYRLFDARETLAAMFRIIHFKLDEAMEPVRRAAPAAEPLLRRMLAHRPEDRFDSGEELIAMMEQLRLDVGPTLATPTSLRKRVLTGPPEPPADEAATLYYSSNTPHSGVTDTETVAVESVPHHHEPSSLAETVVGPTRAAPAAPVKRPRPLLAVGALAGLGLIALLFVLLRPDPGPDSTPTPEPATEAPTAAATPEPATEAPTPEPVTAAPTPQPTARPTPQPTAVATPEPVTPEPTPEPVTPEPTPAPTGPPGTVQVAVPRVGLWEVHVGGAYHSALEAGRGIELPPGRYTILLRCISDCPEGPVERSKQIDLAPGEIEKVKGL